MIRKFQISRIVARRHAKRRLVQTNLYGNDSLVDALSSISRHTRSGLSLATAIQISVSTHPCDLLVRLHHLVSRGFSIGTACQTILESFPESSVNSDFIMVLHVIALANEVGGNIAQQIDALVDTLLDRSQAKLERQTQAATATASMRLITWLPVVCGAWIVSDSAAIRHVLFSTALGWACLTIGVGLNIAGRAWTKRLVRQ